MHLSTLDLCIVATYFVISGLIGFAFSKRAGTSDGEFFAAGRKLPWWLAGTSMVATTFAADTPLAVTGLVAAHGVAGNWVWWSFVAGNLLTVFFFARLWHRSGVRTDAELAELRYGGRPAAALRAFRAAYLALPINLIIMGWVNLAMVKIVGVTLGVPPFPAMLALFALTAVYSAAGGLWAVVVTDFFQFGLAMLGAIALAFFALESVGGVAGLLEKLPAHFGTAERALSPVPVLDDTFMPVTALLSALFVQWWASWYPGSEPGGGGYIAQRIFAAKSERDGMLATLWFTVAHYAVRPWPWILTALVVAVSYPGMADPGEGYVRAVVELLPSGWRGLMLAGFAAAYMSTMSTQLNWGASYLVEDLYVRFVRPTAADSDKVRASRVATVLLMVLSVGVTWLLMRVGSVEAAWRILIALGAGTGTVYLLRWYWWRINAWSEVSAMVASLVCFVVLTFVVGLDPADAREGAVSLMITAAFTTAAWITTTLLTPPEDRALLAAFYTKTRPGGPGWSAVQAHLGLAGEKVSTGWGSLVAWLLGITAVYAALFGTGELLLGSTVDGLALLALAIASFALVVRTMRVDPAR